MYVASFIEFGGVVTYEHNLSDYVSGLVWTTVSKSMIM